jgi:hypothetical protein
VDQLYAFTMSQPAPALCSSSVRALLRLQGECIELRHDRAAIASHIATTVQGLTHSMVCGVGFRSALPGKGALDESRFVLAGALDTARTRSLRQLWADPNAEWPLSDTVLRDPRPAATARLGCDRAHELIRSSPWIRTFFDACDLGGGIVGKRPLKPGEYPDAPSHSPSVGWIFALRDAVEGPFSAHDQLIVECAHAILDHLPPQNGATSPRRPTGD